MNRHAKGYKEIKNLLGGALLSRLVKKFGGTSVADIDSIKNIADRLANTVAEGHKVVVVVSAMGSTTDEMIRLVRNAGKRSDAREYDAAISAGEQISSAIFSAALRNSGVPARSFVGWQVPIETDGQHGNARIIHIGTKQLHACMERGEVPVVAGFQGVSQDGSITTLGRGGSDVTAVALAAALNVDRCDIHTDVSGVYTADPHVVPQARQLETISFDEMMELASSGAKVLHIRSVELAKNFKVKVRVASSFNNNPGTLIVSENEVVEKQTVSAISSSHDEAKITLFGLVDGAAAAARVFEPLAAANINVDMIVQNLSVEGNEASVTFTVPRGDLNYALETLENLKNQVGYESMVHDAGIAKVSAIGVGMRSHAGVAQQMFSALASKGIAIEAISTSEIKISVLIPEAYTELAVRTLHEAYELDTSK